MATFEENIHVTVGTEQGFRNWTKRFGAALAAIGLVKVNSSVNLDALSFATASSQKPNQNSYYDSNTYQYYSAQVFDVYKAFDNITTDQNINGYEIRLATRWRSNAKPTTAQPQNITYDASAPVSVEAYRIFFGNNSADVKTWKYQTSADNVAWTDRETRTNVTGDGWQTFTLPAVATGRYHRLLITDNNGHADHVEIIELELLDEDLAELPAPQSIMPTANGQYPYWEDWRFDDTLKDTTPVYLRFHFGRDDHDGAQPCIDVSIGLDSGFSRAISTGRINLREGVYPTFVSGHSSRLVMVIEHNQTYKHLVFVVERFKSSAGADTADGVAYWEGGWFHRSYYGWTSQNSYQTLAKTGPYQNYSHGKWPILMPESTNYQGNGGSSGVEGQKVHLYPVFPFAIKMLPPSESVFAYFNNDITQGTVFQAPVYGQQRTLRTIGNVPTGYQQSAAIAIIWE